LYSWHRFCGQNPIELTNFVFDSASRPANSPLKSFVHVNLYASSHDFQSDGATSAGYKGALKSHCWT